MNRYLLNSEFTTSLNKQNITILRDFESNMENIQKFCDKYYSNGVPFRVICGMNPGRLGAGKTGIPFIDFNSLSKLLDDVSNEDSEKSAGFIFDVIEEFGRERFFDNFYLTNFCSVGFMKNGANYNFDCLPNQLLEIVKNNFYEEMEVVKPKSVLSLSVSVQNSVCTLLQNATILKERLPHPSWVMTYRSKSADKWKGKYLSTMEKLILEA